MSILEILESQYEDLRRLQEPIYRQLDLLVEQKNNLEYQEFLIRRRIQNYFFELQEHELEQFYEPRDLDILKIEDLPHLPLRIINELTIKYYGIDLAQLPCSTEFTDLTPKEYKEAVLERMEAESCRYCHQLNHKKKQCPLLQYKYCEHCNENGHDMYHCLKTKDKKKFCQRCNEYGHNIYRCPKNKNNKSNIRKLHNLL
jgi:hypothetical protein